ncbi:mitochondrial 54S ribosomal protein mL58 [Lodderomyces beijingensis]|uniref:Uncharacterized protein n=1 Tax=Lodderomyces beijingensis TaxID=1775926 RepID=A0ABP0ZWE5_9ASCO
MLRSTVRTLHHAPKQSIPYVPVPVNKYNAKRSGFNFKPAKTSGLVYNPPAAIVKPSMQTPYLFLPPHDPRRELAKQRSQSISPQVVADMPIIRQFKAPHQREYTITAETVVEMKKLRAENPREWTLRALSKKFNVELEKLVYFFRTDMEKARKSEGSHGDKLELGLRRTALDRQKRREMWLRNEF